MIDAILYSDQVIPENEKIDRCLVAMMETRGRRIGYIPSGPDPDLQFFSQKQGYYSELGLDLDIYYDLDQTHKKSVTETLFSCDAIHLSGGDTGAFLNRMKTSKILDSLRRWANNGGLLIGTSAGAILMTPTIAVDALFNEGNPENFQDQTALNLVPFEFFPHLNAKPSYLPKLVEYSRLNSRPIAACQDGDGIVISSGIAESIGDLVWLSNGRVIEALRQV